MSAAPLTLVDPDEFLVDFEQEGDQDYYLRRRRRAVGAERLVEGELLCRGFVVSSDSVDEGVDLWVDGRAIQVKSASLCDGSYGFGFVNGAASEKAARERLAAGWRRFADIDFFVLVGIDERRFFIVPRSALASVPFRPGIRVGVGPAARGAWQFVLDYEDAWHLLEARA